MPISQSDKIVPNSLVTSTPPETGQIPASDGTGAFLWVDNNGGQASTDLFNFITDIKRRGFIPGLTAVPSLSGTQKDIVTLTDLGAGWSYYFQGKKVNITGSPTIALTGGAGNAHADGLHFVYINDDTGDLKTSTVPFDIVNDVLVAIVAWNSSLPSGGRSLIIDERHTALWDSEIHEYVHLNFGCQKVSGGEMSTYVLESGTDSHKQVSISQAVIEDEDLAHTLDPLVGGNGKYAIVYRTSPGVWGWSTGNNFPYRYTVSGRMNYDNETATGQEVANGKYINVYVLLTNVVGDCRQLFVSSQTEYATVDEAYGATFKDLDLIGFIAPEYYISQKLTFKTDDTITGTGKCWITKVIAYGGNAKDLTPTDIGSPSAVSPSVIGNFVSFSGTKGAQADSGKKPSDFLALATGGTLAAPLNFSGTGNSGVALSNLTTTQRNALTGANGMLVYNTITNRLNPYVNGAWKSGFVRLEGDTMDAGSKFITAASVAGNAGFNIPAGTAPTVLVDGDIYYDSTQKSFVFVEAGLKHDLVGITFSKTNDTTITASVTNAESDLFGTGVGTTTIPANFLTVGRTLRYRASGIFTTSTNSATLIMRIKLGTSILSTTATIDPGNNLTNLGWFLEGDFTIRSTGASGTARGCATFKYASSATAFVESPMVNATTIQVDTTAVNIATPTIQYSQTTAGNSLTCSNFTLELMN